MFMSFKPLRLTVLFCAGCLGFANPCFLENRSSRVWSLRAVDPSGLVQTWLHSPGEPLPMAVTIHLEGFGVDIGPGQTLGITLSDPGADAHESFELADQAEDLLCLLALTRPGADPHGPLGWSVAFTPNLDDLVPTDQLLQADSSRFAILADQVLPAGPLPTQVPAGASTVPEPMVEDADEATVHTGAPTVPPHPEAQY